VRRVEEGDCQKTSKDDCLIEITGLQSPGMCVTTPAKRTSGFSSLSAAAINREVCRCALSYYKKMLLDSKSSLFTLNSLFGKSVSVVLFRELASMMPPADYVSQNVFETLALKTLEVLNPWLVVCQESS
jgi:hypothetical protein